MTKIRPNPEADVLSVQYARDEDRAEMAEGCHYDYKTQSWVAGHDHAHFTSDNSPLMFCGADMVTCTGMNLEYEATR